MPGGALQMETISLLQKTCPCPRTLPMYIMMLLLEFARISTHLVYPQQTPLASLTLLVYIQPGPAAKFSLSLALLPRASLQILSSLPSTMTLSQW